MNGVLVVGQSGGPTPVINATLAGVILEAQGHECFSRIYGLRHGVEGALSESMIDLTDCEAGMLERLVQTPAAALGSSRHKLDDAGYERVMAVFRAHDVRYFAYIGGNGSMFVANKLAEMAAGQGYDLRVIGLPKTVDNDLACTDHAPGFGSAARFLALAARDTGLDLEAMTTFDDVTILEAMGRDSGWLAAAAALCKVDEDDAPHLVYVPEIAFDDAVFLEDVARIHNRLGRVFVVVGEGIHDLQGQFVGQKAGEAGRDMMGRVVHTLGGGASVYLSSLIREHLGLQARSLRPGLIGRALSDSVSRIDRDEALAVGRAGVAHLAAGESGVMVTLEREPGQPYRSRLGTALLSVVAGSEKRLPRAYMNQTGNMISSAFYDYALPLLGDLPPFTRLVGKIVPYQLNKPT